MDAGQHSHSLAWKACVHGNPNALRGETKIFNGHPCLHFFPASFADGPNHALSPIASFLSRLSLGKVAELERPRRHPKAFGIPSNLLTGTPSSVPCPRSDACRAKGVPSMCDYSLDLVASRAAKVGDELVTTQFNNFITRGFAAIGEPNVAVCLLPGTECGSAWGQIRDRRPTLTPICV